LDFLCGHQKPLDSKDVTDMQLQHLLLSLALQYAPANETIASKASKMLVNDSLLELGTVISKLKIIEKASEFPENLVLHILSWFNTLVGDSELAPSRRVILSWLKFKLEEWSAEFEHLLSISEKMSDSHEMTILHLKIRCRPTLVLVQTFPFDDEMAFDHFKADFRYIIEVSRQYMSLRRSATTNSAC
jgi:hypothetical protein